MSLLWQRHEKKADRWDCIVGPFFVGYEFNGEESWNWWIATSKQGACPGEDDCVLTGCADDERGAQQDLEDNLRKFANKIITELDAKH